MHQAMQKGIKPAVLFCLLCYTNNKSVLFYGWEVVHNAEYRFGDKKAMEDFIKIQRHMLIARKENATETYGSLKKEYLYLKSFLNVAGVNLTDIDEIKE